MIHLLEDGTSVDILTKVVPYIKYKRYTPVSVSVCDIQHKGMNISPHSPRYLAADTKYPLIVVRREGALFLVDGRHRLLKAVSNGEDTVEVFILTEQELNLFRQ